MKTFIISLIFFAVILISIVLYQWQLETKVEQIVILTDKIEKSIKDSDYDSSKKQILKLNSSFDGVMDWIMAFEDHNEILQMSQCIQGMKSYAEYDNAEGVLSELYKFRYLLRYSVESLKPSMANIF